MTKRRQARTKQSSGNRQQYRGLQRRPPGDTTLAAQQDAFQSAALRPPVIFGYLLGLRGCISQLRQSARRAVAVYPPQGFMASLAGFFQNIVLIPEAIPSGQSAAMRGAPDGPSATVPYHRRPYSPAGRLPPERSASDRPWGLQNRQCAGAAWNRPSTGNPG